MSEEVENNQADLEDDAPAVKGTITFNKFSAPRPLTEREFDRIVILKYIENMTAKELQTVFDHEPTQEELLAMLEKGTKFPQQLLSAVEKSIQATFKVMQNAALDGKSETSWTIAESFACFTPDELKYIAVKEGNTSNLRPYIRARMSQVSAMDLTLDFVETLENANQIAGSANIVSMKNAEKLYNKLRNYERNLDVEQKSMVYFLSSELYRRAQIIPGVYNEPKPCAKEIFCLRMVLDNTAQPSLIDCCLDRMSRDEKILRKNAGRLISAYKRALSKERVIYPEDEYRINSQIAKLYEMQLRQTAGSFTGLDLDDSSLLRWSEYYFTQAYKKAPNDIQRFEALTELSKVQSHLGLDKQAKETTLKALNLLSEPERFEKMLDMASGEDSQLAVMTIKRTIRKIQKSKMPRGIKNLLGQKAIVITKLKTKNPKVISSVENMVKNTKLTPNNKIVRNVSTHE